MARLTPSAASKRCVAVIKASRSTSHVENQRTSIWVTWAEFVLYHSEEVFLPALI
jgi:hypothetical protein